MAKRSTAATAGRPARWHAPTAALVALSLGLVALGTAPVASGATSGRTPAALVAPRTSAAQDGRYLTDVAQADSDLVTYVQEEGNVALRAMLTDGTAFCAFLRRDGEIDTALEDVALGAHGVESQTRLPASVHTFNTLESVALIDLCPGEQHLVPRSVRAKLQRLAATLRSSSPSRTSGSGDGG